jgi:SAM-dependent methyltransferase
VLNAGQRDYWDDYFRQRERRGEELDWRGRWTDAFLPLLRKGGARSVLELGCGMGSDAARLAAAGFEVTATDLSSEAVMGARRRYPQVDRFEVVDMTERLPFAPESFDAVMANVSLHMFTWDVTRTVFAEVRRVLRPGGLFLFHVNAREDRPLRAERRPVRRLLEPNYVLEEAGQVVRFFSHGDLLALLGGWADVEVERIEIADEGTRDPFKVVWRAVARRPPVR